MVGTSRPQHARLALCVCGCVGGHHGNGEHTLRVKDTQPLGTFRALTLKPAVLASPQVDQALSALRLLYKYGASARWRV